MEELHSEQPLTVVRRIYIQAIVTTRMSEAPGTDVDLNQAFARKPAGMMNVEAVRASVG
jgi:hypothetical protein